MNSRRADFVSEQRKYADPTAGAALAHIMYKEKLARRKARQMERKDGKCVIPESSMNLRHCGKQQRPLAEQSTLVVSSVKISNRSMPLKDQPRRRPCDA